MTARYSFGYSCGDVNDGDIGGLDSADGLLSVYDRVRRSFRSVAAWSSPPVGISVSSGARIVAVERSQRIEAYDVRTGERKPVSVDSRQRSHKGYALDPVISDDGRHVAFTTVARLVAGDSGRDGDVYVRNLSAGRTTRASVGSGGAGLHESGFAAISADGQTVAFMSSRRGTTAGEVYVRDRRRSTTKLVGRGSYPALSADGRAVAFTSAAERLVRGDTNGLADVFVRSPLR